MGRKRRRRTLDQVGDFSTVLGPQSTYMGVFQGKDNYLVYGQVQGECDIDGTLMLGEGSRWRGNIRAANVVIAGTVEGDISATAKLELTSSAQVHGKITSPVMAIARGAVYDGQVRMTKNTQLTRFNERRETLEKEK